jgi:hypothetical protein
MLNLDTYQQILTTDPRFGIPIQLPVNLLEYALDVQIRANRVVVERCLERTSRR